MDRENFGVDVDRLWLTDMEGDLQVVKYEDNVAQAVFNRVSCTMGNLDWLYRKYGSYVKDWIGKPNTPSNRETLCREVQNRIRRDPRLTNATVEIVYWSAKGVGLHITGTYNMEHEMWNPYSNEDFDEYYIFGPEDVSTDKVRYHNKAFKDTYMKTRETGYAGKPGDNLVVHAHVFTKHDQMFVPVGNVSLRVGSRAIATVEIQQSYNYEPGTVTIPFVIPKVFKYGVHKLIFKYHGVDGYNDCICESTLLVVDRMPTNIKHYHTIGTSNTSYNNTLYVDQYDMSTTGAVYVEDWNGLPVTHGTATLSVVRGLTDRVQTRIKMSESDDSWTINQPYLIENCYVVDKYGKTVPYGNINMYVRNGHALATASADIENLSFTVDSLSADTTYRLEDSEGNLVDTLSVEEDEGNVTLVSSNSIGSDVITIN